MEKLSKIEKKELIRLSPDEQRQLAEALENPPDPTPALRRAFERYRELFGKVLADRLRNPKRRRRRDAAN